MNENRLPKISDELVKKVTSHRTNALDGVVKIDPNKLATDYLDLNRAQILFDRIRPYLPVNKGRLLEMGSGFGPFVAYSLKWEHIQAFGIEPNPDSVSICSNVLGELKLPDDRIVRAVGEMTPFASDTMDVVCSFTVFEHVQNPSQVLAEAIRVLKPGGVLYFTFPNYGSWWEGHYGILWLPHISKWFAKVYVRLLGRNPNFLTHLQLIDYRKLKQILFPFLDRIEVIETGFTVWEDRMKKINIEDWAQMSRLKSWVRILHKLRLVEIVIWLGRIFHWETPFVLILRKKPAESS